jgi:AcrR family transcriptional regulator
MATANFVHSSRDLQEPKLSLRTGDTRQRIKNEATRLFVEHGVADVSVRDIALAVGMKAPNLYAHFRSRDDLVQELFAEGYAAYGALMAEAAASVPDFRGQLEAMLRLICRLHDEDVVRFRFLLLSQHASLANISPGDQRNPVDTLQRIIEAAMQRGELPALDPALLAAMVVGVVVQTATFVLYGRVRATMTDLADTLVAACEALAFRNLC